MKWRFLKKLKIKLPHDAEIPLLPKVTKPACQRNICTPMFMTALLMIAKTWKQPKCPSTDE
jgi:hypothetical protein